jgi:hypothetical protein
MSDSGRGSYNAGEAAVYSEQFYLGCLAHASYLIGSEGEVNRALSFRISVMQEDPCAVAWPPCWSS